MGWVVVIGGLAVLIAISVAVHRAERLAALKRQKDLLVFARHNGYAYHPMHVEPKGAAAIFGSLLEPFVTPEEQAFLRLFTGWKPFCRGHAQTVTNILVKRENEMDWYLFDLSCQVSSGESTATEQYGIVVARVPYALPALGLFRESLSEHLADILCHREVQFESAEFNKRYFVSCSDRKAAFDLIHPETIDWLMTTPIVDWQMAGPFVVVYKEGVCSVQESQRLKAAVQGFIERIPEYVRTERRFAPSWKSVLDQTGLQDNFV